MKSNYTINFSKKKFWLVIVPLFILVSIVGGITGVLVIDKVVMPNVVGVNKEEVAVPAIASLSWEAGRQKLYDVRLRGNLKKREFDDLIPLGHIIRTFPDAGATVKQGRIVDVIVSKGTLVDTLPDVLGLSEKQARIELRKRHFSLGSVRRIFDEDIEVDNVIKMVPGPGTTISREIEVDLFVSDGPQPTHADVPNIIGDPVGDARTRIADAGLRVGTVTYRDNPSLTPGTVLSQSIAPGERVLLESRIDIVVAVVKAQ